MSNQIATVVKPAGLANRIVATLIDFLGICFVVFCIQLFLYLIGFTHVILQIIIGLVLLQLLGFMYRVVFLSLFGQTVGKNIARIKVINKNFKKASFFDVIVRETVGKLFTVMTLYVGYFWVIVDSYNRGFHEIASNTMTVRTVYDTQFLTESKRNKRISFIVFTLVYTIFLSGILVLFCVGPVVTYTYALEPHWINGSSMEPTFQDGSFYLTNKLIYKIQEPKRGDVIVFSSPQDSSMLLVKRIVAIPGDTFELRNGTIYLNGSILKEEYLKKGTQSYGALFLREDKIYSVPENEFVVLGDNRENSRDSRFFGLIEKENIIGKLTICYWKCE